MSTDTSTSSTSTATASNSNDLPCVQYGFPDGEGPYRAPKLRTVFEPIPEGAHTASPVYSLSEEKYERQREMENPYRVGNGYKMKATGLQDECEANDRVRYPVHIESDVYREEGPDTLISWFREFVEDYLKVPFDTCTLYFSGNRSIHVHVPRFVSGETDRKRLKELAESFCEETGADLDLGLYSRKRIFRLPDVEHEKSGLSKVEIQPTWNNRRIFDEASRVTPSTPATYADVLWDVFGQEHLTVGTSGLDVDASENLFEALDSDKTLLEFTPDEPEDEIETPLIERVSESPEDPADVPEWSMYNTQEFSPYALASGNPRSVAALRVKDGAFARRDKRGTATMVPAYFYGAIGCNGGFTKHDVHAPLQLSKMDYRKWDYSPGEKVVINGGKSGSSRIFSVSSREATEVGHALRHDEDGRNMALNYLAEQGYDIGASGSATSSSTETTASKSGEYSNEIGTIWPARENQGNDVEALQWKAEQGDIHTLSRGEKVSLACRFLQNGWQPTWEWFEEQFGSTFKPEVTWRNLKGIVENPDFEKYDDVDVPPKPT